VLGDPFRVSGLACSFQCFALPFQRFALPGICPSGLDFGLLGFERGSCRTLRAAKVRDCKTNHHDSEHYDGNAGYTAHVDPSGCLEIVDAR